VFADVITIDPAVITFGLDSIAARCSWRVQNPATNRDRIAIAAGGATGTAAPRGYLS
jgi:hypothetical protein